MLKRKGRKKNKRLLITMIVAGILATTASISGVVNFLTNRKKNQNVNLDKPKTSISTFDLSDLGNELNIIEETKPIYIVLDENINVDELVEKNDKVYIDQESADKSDTVGNVVIDTKEDTLIVKPDGTVTEKEEGYKIKDETGEVIESGEGKLPEGYVETEEEGKYLPEGYVYSDATYYNEEGIAILIEGSAVSKADLEYAKMYLTTIAPTQTTTPSVELEPTTTPSTEIYQNEGILNEDGTYSIFGLTFLSKEDYEQWILQGYEGYAEIDGIMQPETKEIKEYQKIK